MATVATHASDGLEELSTSLPERRYDHRFFSAMAVLILATVLAGFAPSYYFAGMFRAPLPSTIIHVHGAVFSCWILLLIMQTSLVSAGRVDVHRRLGITGFLFACLMVVVGLVAATDALVRGVGRDPLAFYMLSIIDMVIFPTLVFFFAFRARFNPPAHKRTILVATIALMPAAIARLPFAVVHRKPPMACLASYIFLLLLVAYDLCSHAKFIARRFGQVPSSSSCTRSAVRLQKPRLGTRLRDGCRHGPVDEAQMAMRTTFTLFAKHRSFTAVLNW